MAAQQDAIGYADINVGVAPLVAIRDAVGYADINIGLAGAATQTVIHQAAGWGVTPIPPGSTTKLLTVDAVGYADINVT